MPELRDIPQGTILGLNYTGLHDAALVAVAPSGDISFACSLERVTRHKRDGRWPEALLSQVPWRNVVGVAISSLDFDAASLLGKSHGVAGWPLRTSSGQPSVGRYPVEWQEKIASLPVQQWRYDHHLCHAASAYGPSRYQDALVLTCDAGAYQCPWFAAAYRGRGRDLETLGGMRAGEYHSPANVYTIVTAMLGLRPNAHEGKVTGLAARGSATEERVADFERRMLPLVSHLGDLLQWDMNWSGEMPPLISVNVERARQWRHDFGDYSDADLAACVQAWAEIQAGKMLDRAIALCGEDIPKSLCLAGGLFANVRINQTLIERFDEGFVAPPMTDDGTALGAALLAHREHYPDASTTDRPVTMYLGHDIGNDDAEQELGATGVRPEEINGSLATAVADLLRDGKTVAMARGAMEFGPRALGHRSILRRAEDASVNDWLNQRLQRTEYMPFAPMTPAFECEASYRDGRMVTPFMTVTVDCTEAMAAACPAVVHVDGTARPQRVSANDDPFLFAVLKSLHDAIGVGTVLNTSFNMHEEPIVCSAQDALDGFARAELDALVIGDQLVLRRGNEAALAQIAEIDRDRGLRGDKVAALSRWLDSSLNQLHELERLKREWFDPELARLHRDLGTAHAEFAMQAQEFGAARAELERSRAAIAAIHASITWRLSRLFDVIRRGDLRGLAAHMVRFVGHRFGWAARLLRRRSAPHQNTLEQLEKRTPKHSPPELSQLREQALKLLPDQLPTVAAIVPCYNYGRLVIEAVASLRAQTYPKLDIVVVNDGSTDKETLVALRELEAERVRVVHQSNTGLVGARQAGANETDSDLLLFLDNDDLLEPEAITLLAAHLAEHPDCAFAYPSQRFIGDQELCWEPQEYNAFDILWSNHPTVCSLIRREAFNEVGGYDARMVYGWEDWSHWIALSAKGHFGSRVAVPVFQHRRHGKTMTHTAADKGTELRASIIDGHPTLYEPSRITEVKRRWRPAVSVVVPFYNAHEYFHETLECLQQQTLEDFEVVVVNDASDAPESLAVLDQLREGRDGDGLTLRVVNREIRGDLAAARNTGVLSSRADFVFFLDPDDLILPTALEKLCWLLINTPDAGFTYSGVEHFGAKTGVCIDEYDAERLGRENFLTSAAMVRRDLYLRVGGMDESERLLFEDYDFWLRLAALGIGGKLLPEVLFRYRRHEGGRSAWVRRQLSDGQMLDVLKKRNPVFFGKAKEHPAHYRAMELPTTPVHELEQDLRARYLLDQRIPVDSFRRTNLPNLFPVRHWSTTRQRVLYLIPYMTIGGAERIDLDILEGIRATGAWVTLVVEQDEPRQWADRFVRASDEIVQLSQVAPAGNVQQLADHLVVSRNIDMVFIRNSRAGYEMAERWAARGERHVRFVDLLHVHNFGQDWCRQSATRDHCLHRRYVTNDDLLQYMNEQYGLNHDRFRRIYCGVDSAASTDDGTRSAAVRSEIKIPADRLVVGFVGRLDHQKNPQLWLAAVERIAAVRTDIDFVMIGDGPLGSELRRRISSLSCRDRVHMLGHRNDIPTTILALDLLLLTSRYEGLPQVVFEAMAAGVPVVSSDAGGTRECVTDDVGVIVELDSGPERYAEAVLNVLSDRDQLALLSTRCRARIQERFDVESMKNAYRAELTELCGEVDRAARLRGYLDLMMQGELL